MLNLVADVAAGAFLCNSHIPHLAAGLRGELFPRPSPRHPGIEIRVRPPMCFGAGVMPLSVWPCSVMRRLRLD